MLTKTLQANQNISSTNTANKKLKKLVDGKLRGKATWLCSDGSGFGYNPPTELSDCVWIGDL